MQNHYKIPYWKTAPFTRILFPFIAGISVQFHQQFSCDVILIFVACFGISSALLFYLPLALRFRFVKLRGSFIQVLIAGVAMLVTWQKDNRHRPGWYGKYYNDSCWLVIRIDEPPVSREPSVKALAQVVQVVSKEKIIETSGKLLVYFYRNDSFDPPLYGDEILVRKPLKPIKNTGNPGAFDYERYAAFQQIFHSVYLQKKNYVVLSQNKKSFIDKTLFRTRDLIIATLRRYLPKDKDIAGIAEALLIGYKEDLDRDLVQTYTNTGVVHIIAISGLHLGLLYVTLSWLLNNVSFVKKKKLLHALLTLAFLWFFALLTGASASVLRSAVMFTCIVIGQHYFKQASIYNSLAASAVLLLCFDPYFLWDVGFQLSYLAIYGIAWLQKPIYHLWYIKHKWADKIWKMAAVSIAAQVITTPVCLYYFHQFPNYFLITNLVAVPLSTFILFAEIILLAVSWWQLAAIYIGKITGWLVWLMNAAISYCDHLPGSLTDNIYSNIASTILLYLFVICMCCWFCYRQKRMLHLGYANALLLLTLYGYFYYESHHQSKIVIYNIPQHPAIDFIYKNRHLFKGDSILQANRQLFAYTLRPAHIELRATIRSDSIPAFWSENEFLQYGPKKIMITDGNTRFSSSAHPLPIDILVISKNTRVAIRDIIKTVSPAIIIFDGSNSLWKIEKWKKECEQLLLPCFSVQEQGAYITDVDL